MWGLFDRAVIDPLTPREKQIARMAGSMTNREIAAALAISHNTVKQHVQSALEKMGIASRRDFAARLKGDDE